MNLELKSPNKLLPQPFKEGWIVAFWVSDIEFVRGKVIEYYETTQQYSIDTHGTHRLVHADDIWLGKEN